MNRVAASAFMIGIVIGGSFLVIVGGLGWFAGPAIESRFFPVLKPEFVIGSINRKEHETCWGMHMVRLRDGVPVRFDYRAIYQGHTYALNVDRIDENTGVRTPLNQYGFAQHKQGQDWHVIYCAEMPRAIPREGPFSVEGEGYYDTGHPWREELALPAFEVPPGN